MRKEGRQREGWRREGVGVGHIQHPSMDTARWIYYKVEFKRLSIYLPHLWCQDEVIPVQH